MATVLQAHSATGTRTRVARVRAEYPNQLDYSGCEVELKKGASMEQLDFEIGTANAWCARVCAGKFRGADDNKSTERRSYL